MKNKISHGDAVFAILRPGLILHADQIQSTQKKYLETGTILK